MVGSRESIAKLIAHSPEQNTPAPKSWGLKQSPRQWLHERRAPGHNFASASRFAISDAPIALVAERKGEGMLRRGDAGAACGARPRLCCARRRFSAGDLKVKAPLAAVLVVRALFSSARVVLALTPGNPKSGGYERVVACGEADEWPKNPLEWIRRIVCGRRGPRWAMNP